MLSLTISSEQTSESLRIELSHFRWLLNVCIHQRQTVRCRNRVVANRLFAGSGDHFRVIGIGSSLGGSK